MTVIGFITNYNRLMRKLDKLSQSEVKMVFKCKDSEKDVVVEVSTIDDGGDVDIYLNDIRVAYFDSATGCLQRCHLTLDNIVGLNNKGIKIDEMGYITTF